MRVAAVDCGTNTIRLLIADLDPATGERIELARELRYVRLGQGVDRTGRLSPEAVGRTLDASAEYASRCASHGVERVVVAATSAARDAANADELLDGMAQRLGTRPQILSGTEEARLSWLGAMRSLAGASNGPLPPEQLVVDLGGGSTELIRGDIAELSAAYHAGAWSGAANSGGTDGMRAAVSLDIGSVRFTERHLTADPPTPDQIAAAAAEADAAFDGAGLDLSRVGSVIGVAGSITTIAAQVLRRTGGDPSRVHHVRLPIGDVLDTCMALVEASVAERRSMPYLPEKRADVIGGGAIVLDRLLRRLAPTLRLDRLVVSEHDILDGLAWSAVER